MPTAVAATLVVGWMGWACGDSSLKSGAADAGGARGGQGGSSIAHGNTGESGGTSGVGGVSLCLSCAVSVGGAGGHCDAPPSCNPGDIPVTSDADCLDYPDSCYVNEQCGQATTCRRGADASMAVGGSNGDGGEGGAGGSSPLPIFFPICNPGDQQVASGVRTFYDYVKTDLSGDCPAGRECYSLDGSTGPILCMLPEGEHCNDPLSCNPGDTQAEDAEAGCATTAPSPCYKARLCTQFVLCKSAADAGMPAVVCTGVWSDGLSFATPGPSADGGSATSPHCCGDGIVDRDEECDLGDLNSVPVDTSSWPWTANPKGIVWCNSQCRNPNGLCEPTPNLGGMFCD